jgi:tRNA U38,U39,U40 pseudouridine synthase TruA
LLSHLLFQAIADPAALGATIRSHLPPDVTIFGAPRKVANSFNAKNAASSRRYEYILPTYVFARAPLPSQSAAAPCDDDAALPPPSFADDDDDIGGLSPPHFATAPLV